MKGKESRRYRNKDGMKKIILAQVPMYVPNGIFIQGICSSFFALLSSFFSVLLSFFFCSFFKWQEQLCTCKLHGNNSLLHQNTSPGIIFQGWLNIRSPNPACMCSPWTWRCKPKSGGCMDGPAGCVWHKNIVERNLWCQDTRNPGWPGVVCPLTCLLIVHVPRDMERGRERTEKPFSYWITTLMPTWNLFF